MRAHEGHLGLLIRHHVHPNVEAPQLGWLQLDISCLEIDAGQVHDPVHHFLGPATLIHRNPVDSLAPRWWFSVWQPGSAPPGGWRSHRHGCRCWRLQVLEAVIDQPTESFLTTLAGAVLVRLHIEHARHAGGKDSAPR